MDETTFPQKDYELKINYLVNQFTRMWTRFNYFLGVETTLIGGTIIFSKDVRDSTHFILLCLLGSTISIAWYIMGAEDRWLVELYREQVKKAFEKLNIAEVPPSKYDCYVGQVDDLPEAFKKDLSKDIKPDWTGWRRKYISTTRLAAVIPFIVTIVWIVAVIYGLLCKHWCKP